MFPSIDIANGASSGIGTPNTIAPDGSKVYVTHNAWHQSWQTTTASDRPMEGVVLSGPSGDSLIEVNRGASGDARGSGANSLTAEFPGAYN